MLHDSDVFPTGSSVLRSRVPSGGPELPVLENPPEGARVMAAGLLAADTSAGEGRNPAPELDSPDGARTISPDDDPVL